MMMAKHPIRALSWGMAAARRLCTATLASAAATGEGSPEYKPLYRRLSGVGAVPDGSVTKAMDGWIKEGRAVTPAALVKYVRELRRFKSYKHALELLDWMESRGMSMSVSIHAIRLDLIAKVKGIDLAESYFYSLPDSAKNLLTYGALMGSYCHLKMADNATALYEKMKVLNLTSSTLVHNNLMTLYMKLGQPEKVPTLFQEMKANNISRDVFTYCILMNSYGSLGDIDSVEKIIQEMKDEEVSLDWSTYANLAGLYNSAGLFEKAEYALEKLEEVMGSRNRDAFHFLISLYAGAGNLAEVNRVWKSLKASFTKTTNMSYYTMLVALNRLDDIDALKQCFEEWESVYVTYDIRLVNVMIGAYLRKDLMKEADALLKKATEKGVGTDIRTHELFMDYFMKIHETDSALKCFELAISLVKQDRWKPDKEKLTAFLKYLEEVKDVDRAEVFCKSLKKLGCLDGEAYESLLRTYVAAGKKDPSLHKRIKDDGIKMTNECEKLVETVCMTD